MNQHQNTEHAVCEYFMYGLASCFFIYFTALPLFPLLHKKAPNAIGFAMEKQERTMRSLDLPCTA